MVCKYSNSNSEEDDGLIPYATLMAVGHVTMNLKYDVDDVVVLESYDVLNKIKGDLDYYNTKRMADRKVEIISKDASGYIIKVDGIRNAIANITDKHIKTKA